jgi:E3 ubiquitin-protein ligase HUWE1
LYNVWKTNPDDTQPLQKLLLIGMNLALKFYIQIADSRRIMEAPQTLTLVPPRPVPKESLEYFNTEQFVVELRLQAMRSVEKMWPNFINQNEPYKPLMQLVRLILEGGAEDQAIKRSENIVQKGRVVRKKWLNRVSPEVMTRLRLKVQDETLLTEALFRCNQTENSADKYLDEYSNARNRNERNPVPQGVVDESSGSLLPPLLPITGSSDSMRDESSSPDPSNMLSGHDSDADSSAYPQIPELDDLGEVPNVQLPPISTITAEVRAKDQAEETRTPPTIDELEEKRDKLRETLIEDCSAILAERDDVNFELRDLIKAASIHKDWQQASGVGDQIIAMFESLATSLGEFSDVDEANNCAKQLGSITYFMALVFQDQQFWNEQVKEICTDCLDHILRWFEGSDEFTNQALWAPKLLVLLEMILSADSQPFKVEWTNPKDTDPIEPPPEKLSEDVGPVLALKTDKDRVKTLERTMAAVLNVGRRINGDNAFAEAYTRVLAILTRHRNLALVLAEKENITGFFNMLRSLDGTANKDMASNVLIIFRHIIEDDEVIRQIMRSEILSYHKNSNRQHDDLERWLRHFNVLAIRAPEIFIEVTDELMWMPKWDAALRHNLITLKPPPPPDAPSESQPTEDQEPSKESADKQEDKDDKAKDVKEQKDDVLELKMPVLQNSEGLISFMLQEVLKLKDDDDKSDKPEPNGSQDDVEMIPVDSLPAAPVSPASSTGNDDVDNRASTIFKIEDHPNFRYRCFLLAALTELLACYNKAKIEFISHKAKLDNAGTPSKPRSGPVRFLLTNLVPVRTISHEATIAFQKRDATSRAACELLTGLVSKTWENGPYTAKVEPNKSLDMSSYIEEPELLYVRHFVIDQCLRSLKEAQESTEPADVKYSRILKISDLFYKMVNHKPNATNGADSNPTDLSNKMLAKIMYEKGLISALSNVIGEIDLKQPNARRVVKYALRPLKHVAVLANDLNTQQTLQTLNVEDEDDDDEEDGRFSEELDHVFNQQDQSEPEGQFSSIQMYRPEHRDAEMAEDEGEEFDEVEVDYDEDVIYDEDDDDNSDDEMLSDEEMDPDTMEIDEEGSEMDIEEDGIEDISEDSDLDDEDDDDLDDGESGDGSNLEAGELDEDDDEEGDDDLNYEDILPGVIGQAPGVWGSDVEEENEDPAPPPFHAPHDVVLTHHILHLADEFRGAEDAENDDADDLDNPHLDVAMELENQHDFMNTLLRAGGMDHEDEDAEDDYDEDEDEDEEADEAHFYHPTADGTYCQKLLLFIRRRALLTN